MVKEGIRPGARQPVGIPGSRVEQTNHRVEVAVGPASAAPAVERRAPPTRRDAKGRPDRPQHGFGADLGGPASRVIGPPGSPDTGEDRPGQPPQGLPVHTGLGTEHRVAEGCRQQLVARPSSPAVELDPAQRPSQPAQRHRVAPTQHRQAEVDGLSGRDHRVRVAGQSQTQVEQREQRPDGDLVAHRDLTIGRGQRHPGGRKHPAQSPRATTASDEDGHVAPRHTLLQVRATQRRGDEPRLLGDRAKQRHLHLTAVANGLGPAPVRAAGRPDPAHNLARRVVEPGRCPVCRAQHHRGRIAQSGPPVPPQQPWVGPAEGLDRAVGVADEDDLHSGMGDGSKESSCGPSELLRVVDDDQPDLLAHPLERLGVVLEQVSSGGEDPGRVVGTRLRQRRHLVVFVEDRCCRHPLRAVVLASELGEVGRVDSVLDGPHE